MQNRANYYNSNKNIHLWGIDCVRINTSQFDKENKIEMDKKFQNSAQGSNPKVKKKKLHSAILL